MRLICPNCDAEYQVDDAAVPASGRDVQCSNCGHAWFQIHADAESAQEAEDALFGEAPVADAASVAGPTPPEPAQVEPAQVEPTQAELTQAAPMVDAAGIDMAGGDTAGVDADPPVDDAVQQPVAARQSLAESVLSVLREEAARETAVRREEGPVDAFGSVEMQPDLGLQDVAQSGPTSAAARHIARLKGTEPDAAASPDLSAEPDIAFEAGPRATARRDLLPDIEEINSTLRANADRAKDADDEIEALPNLRPKRGGFRSGFVLMMILAVVFAMAYIMAPRIIAQIPGSAPTLRVYVSAVDAGRLWLDGVMQSASGSLRSLTGDAK